ncbi:hypothetical protein PV328_007294 [Microctonus aethiopoides]|uniref:Titin-like n=1 Tax=Microctonus aethiopoides TaxID=144406 RepID=A0AA39FRK1_9HYME|nr:hypothetical protein PV328_007294 [Microctonus aethiopoides]
MGQVIPVTLALCAMVSITLATPLNSEKIMLDCGYQQSPEEKYSWEKLHFEKYHTIDPNDLNDPTVGVLRAEELDNYKTDVQSMDIRTSDYENKPNNEPITKINNQSINDDNDSDESINTESRMSNYHSPDNIEEHEEKIITIVKNVEVPYPVEKKIPYPVIKKIPYPVKVPVAQPYPIEKPIPYPVKVIVKVPVRIPHPYPVYKNTHYAVQVPIERRVPYPVYIPSPVPIERKINYEVQVPVLEPFPVERTVPIRVKIPIAVPQPIPVEKRVHYPVEVKVDRPIAVPIAKPYPVQVIKPVPYPVFKERPLAVEVKVDRPVPYPVYQPIPFPVKVPVPHRYPVEKKIPYTVVKNVPYPVEVPVERPVPIHVEKHVPVGNDGITGSHPGFYTVQYKPDVHEIPQADDNGDKIESRKDLSDNNDKVKEDLIEDGSKDKVEINDKDKLVEKEDNENKEKEVVQLFGVAFLCLSVALTGSASRKEELERAAELAVERAAERVAERAVEKALESGNSSSETETIRVSHSSVRKYDKTQQLPGFVYTPATRREYERIAKEKEAGELAVAEIMRGRIFKRAIVNDRYKYKDPREEQQENDNIFSNGPNLVNKQSEETNQHENQMKLSSHPVTVSEISRLYPVISYQSIPIEEIESSNDKKPSEVHHYDIPAKTLLYHPVKLLKISQVLPTVHYYHRPPMPQSIRPIYLFPKVEMSKNTNNDQASTH